MPNLPSCERFVAVFAFSFAIVQQFDWSCGRSVQQGVADHRLPAAALALMKRSLH